MEIIDELTSHDIWLRFLEYKTEQGNLSKSELNDLSAFIHNKEYLTPAGHIQNTLGMSVPVMSEINKNGTGKKRRVFEFRREENYILKLIAFLLHGYDSLFCDNLYSFRNSTGVRRAVDILRKRSVIRRCYSYKADIHDYFNSVDTQRMLDILSDTLKDESKLLTLIQNILTDPYALYKGEITAVKKGIMAGNPISGFLANLYLSDMDRYFRDRGILYMRYSDDIIVFSQTKEESERFEQTIKRFIAEKGLTINHEKEYRTSPGESVEFLGFELGNNMTDIADITLKKLKAKMKRKARALYRWKCRKNADDERTAKAYIRFLNNKFYDNALKGEITWSRWYFPVITTDRKLRIIDDYAVECIRFLYTGRYSKLNYNIRYDTIKALGFRSLVNSYWKYRKGEPNIGQ